VQLERMAVAVRPRSGLESLDLGFQMARQWWRQAWGIWLALYVPAAVVALAAFSNKFYAVLALWWIKPLFDRAVLYGLSRLVFGEQTGVAATLRAARDWMRPGLFLALSLRRFEWARSFELPVASLEKQSGKSARQRRAVLGSRMRSTAVWLTLVCIHFEMIAMVSLFALGSMLMPSAGEIPGYGSGRNPGVSDFFNLTSWDLTEAICYAVAVSLIEPFYVAAGFSLYLNRRTILEGWDMEIRLRQLGDRLRSAATPTAMLLCAAIVVGSATNTAHAADTATPNAAEEIAQVLADPDFEQYREVTHWRALPKEEKPEKEKEPKFAQFWRNLMLLLSDIVQGLMWVAVAILVPVLLYLFRHFVPEPRIRQSQQIAPPANLVGLNVAPESLPADISGTAARFAEQGRLREALSLLYRGALSTLIHRYRVAVRDGATEGDCAKAARSALNASGAAYFFVLVAAWQQLAYGATAPDASCVDSLCRDWETHFGSLATPSPAERI